jgi:hypothetical protein
VDGKNWEVASRVEQIDSFLFRGPKRFLLRLAA